MIGGQRGTDRVIKFRAWDIEGKKMFYPLISDLATINHKKFVIQKENFGPVTTIELMQFTGLHDKNGKEIYEGDILKLNNSLFTIKFMGDYNFGYILHYAKTNDYYAMLNADHLKKVEVIGNIYEHPHLLEGVK